MQAAAALTPRDAEAIRATFLNRFCVELFPPDAPDPRQTLYLRILDELSQRIVELNLAQTGGSAHTLTHALTYIEASMLAWVQSAGDEWGSMDVWRHKAPDETATEDWNAQRTECLGTALTHYYGQPARSLLLDRVFIDMLMALQVRGLATEPPPAHVSRVGKVTASSQSLVSVLLSIAGRSLLTVLVLALLFITAKWGIDTGHLDPAWTATTTTLAVALSLLSMPLFILNRLGKWGDAQQHHRAAQLYAAATDAYATLAHEHAPVSLTALHAALNQAELTGLNWIGIDRVLADLQRRGVTELPTLSPPTQNSP